MADQHNTLVDTQCDQVATMELNKAKGGSVVAVGHLLSLSFPNGGQKLEAKWDLPDPENPSSKIPCLGLFDFIFWEGGRVKPIDGAFRLSPKNAGKLQAALASAEGGAEINIKFVIYKYDMDEKIFYKHFYSDEDLMCIVNPGSKMVPNPRPAADITSPVNYVVPFSLKGKSKGKEQEVNVCFSATDKTVHVFGVNET